MNFPRDAWRIPQMLSSPDSGNEIPEQWALSWQMEQEARKICDDEILRDISRLLGMNDARMCTTLTQDLFDEMTYDWPHVVDYHMKIQRFRQLRQEHLELLTQD